MILVAIGLVLLGVAYVHGSFDRALSGVGLNFHECKRNGLGATFCGKELEEYEERTAHARESVAHAKRALESAGREGRERQEAAEVTRALDAGKARQRQEAALEARLARERAIVEAEPKGSVASDLASGEYEAARAELQQIRAE